MKLNSGETASSRRTGGVRRFLPVFLCVFLSLSAAPGAFAQSAREYPDKRSGDEACRIEPHIVQAVDTTGAGDLWQAGFLYGWLNGFGLEKAGRMG